MNGDELVKQASKVLGWTESNTRASLQEAGIVSQEERAPEAGQHLIQHLDRITYIREDSGDPCMVGMDDFRIEHDPGRVWVNEEYGGACLSMTPNQADALADALKAHARFSREGSHE